MVGSGRQFHRIPLGLEFSKRLNWMPCPASGNSMLGLCAHCGMLVRPSSLEYATKETGGMTVSVPVAKHNMVARLCFGNIFFNKKGRIMIAEERHTDRERVALLFKVEGEKVSIDFPLLDDKRVHAGYPMKSYTRSGALIDSSGKTVGLDQLGIAEKNDEVIVSRFIGSMREVITFRVADDRIPKIVSVVRQEGNSNPNPNPSTDITNKHVDSKDEAVTG
jgi:hypothetical protein